jgi:hypothetical protein
MLLVCGKLYSYVKDTFNDFGKRLPDPQKRLVFEGSNELSSLVI